MLVNILEELLRPVLDISAPFCRLLRSRFLSPTVRIYILYIATEASDCDQCLFLTVNLKTTNS